MDIEKLIEDLRGLLKQYGEKIPYGELVGAPWPYSRDGDLVWQDPEPYFIEQAAAALSTLQAENEKLQDELERKNEALDFSKTTNAEAVRLKADLIRVTAERDALIKRTAGDCWSCIRRYECNNRKGPHKRCWEFDPWLLRED